MRSDLSREPGGGKNATVSIVEPTAGVVALSRFTAWHRVHLYGASRKGIPKSVELVLKNASVTRFDVVAT